MSKTKNAAPEVNHDFTAVANKAIADNGTPLLKALAQAGPLVLSFIYRPKGFFSVRQAGLKGILLLSGSIEQYTASLPDDVMAQIGRASLGVSDDDDTDGRRRNGLQVLQRQILKDISSAMEKAGHQPLVFEEEFTNRFGYDTTAYVKVIFNEYLPPEEVVEATQERNAERKNRRMGEAAGVVDTTKSAEFADSK